MSPLNHVASIVSYLRNLVRKPQVTESEMRRLLVATFTLQMAIIVFGGVATFAINTSAQRVYEQRLKSINAIQSFTAAEIRLREGEARITQLQTQRLAIPFSQASIIASGLVQILGFSRINCIRWPLVPKLCIIILIFFLTGAVALTIVCSWRFNSALIQSEYARIAQLGDPSASPSPTDMQKTVMAQNSVIYRISSVFLACGAVAMLVMAFYLPRLVQLNSEAREAILRTRGELGA